MHTTAMAAVGQACSWAMPGDTQLRSKWPERSDRSVTVTCIFPLPHILVIHTAQNAFYFKNSFNTKVTTVHLSPGISERLIILTTLAKKSIPGMGTWKFCTGDERTKTNKLSYYLKFYYFIAFSDWPRPKGYKHCLTTQKKLWICFCL